VRVISCDVDNFASYKSLTFNFENQGLTLIQGPTGSGKSTLCDLIPWVLFGRTAKDGAVDEVISWNADGPTEGTILIELPDKTFLYITRSRKPNDLFFNLEGEETRRGKDLNDTQKLINDLLGVDVNTYLAGAYFHEFSQTAQFFTTTAKNRRLLCEQMVDLSLAKTLQANLTQQAKALTKNIAECDNKTQVLTDRLKVLASKSGYTEKSKTFLTEKAAALKKLQDKAASIQKKIKPSDDFESALADLKHIAASLGSDRCSECGAKKNSDEWETIKLEEMRIKQEMRENQGLKQELVNLNSAIQQENARENTYLQLEEERQADIKSATATKLKLEQEFKDLEVKIADIELMLDVVVKLRSASIQNTITSLESDTNRLLSEYYNAEFRVEFLIENSEKLEVTITKDGNVCSYSQLSKGQRCLLKLCFGVSAMRTVANHSGVKFNAIFLDESMDGMDDGFKVKTYRLLESLSLEYESVFVVEHSEAIKTLFHNKYSVDLVGGSSQIEKA
jgi:DNA repair exonuclease SbcCD ATPase subunit